MSEKIVLSHEDTIRWNEIAHDEKSYDVLLKKLLNELHNSLESLQKSKQQLWAHMYQAYKLNPDIDYKLEYSLIDRRCTLTEKGKNKN